MKLSTNESPAWITHLRAAVVIWWLCLPPSNMGEMLVSLCHLMVGLLEFLRASMLNHQAVLIQAPASL